VSVFAGTRLYLRIVALSGIVVFMAVGRDVVGNSFRDPEVASYV
jgi:hypothetical protein